MHNLTNIIKIFCIPMQYCMFLFCHWLNGHPWIWEHHTFTKFLEQVAMYFLAQSALFASSCTASLAWHEVASSCTTLMTQRFENIQSVLWHHSHSFSNSGSMSMLPNQTPSSNIGPPLLYATNTIEDLITANCKPWWLWAWLRGTIGAMQWHTCQLVLAQAYPWHPNQILVGSYANNFKPG